MNAIPKQPSRKSTAKALRSGQKGEAPTYQLNISLDHAEPPIWRRLLVRGDVTLGQLHYVIQAAMGWEDEHLHQFVVGQSRFTNPRTLDDAFSDGRDRDENEATLMEIAPKARSKFRYEYDFGDSWDHTVKVEKILPPETGEFFARCLEGERACPPEDCGGVWGYSDLLQALKKPKTERQEELLEWIGGEFDAEAFDVEGVNDCLKAMARPSGRGSRE